MKDDGFRGRSPQPSGLILHSLVLLSRKKNSLPGMEVERLEGRQAAGASAAQPEPCPEAAQECSPRRRGREAGPPDTWHRLPLLGLGAPEKESKGRGSRKRNSAPRGENVIICLREIPLPPATATIFWRQNEKTNEGVFAHSCRGPGPLRQPDGPQHPQSGMHYDLNVYVPPQFKH